MLQNWLRRSFAAGILATALSLGSASADKDTKRIDIWISQPFVIDAEAPGAGSRITKNVTRGLPWNSEMVVEWWEWDNRRHRYDKNEGCSFYAGVTSTGEPYASDDVEYTFNQWSRVTPKEKGHHQYRIKKGCDPDTVATDNSFLRIYNSKYDEGHIPILLTSFRIQSGKKNKIASASHFRIMPPTNRGFDADFSLSDDCFIEDESLSHDNSSKWGLYDVKLLNINTNPVIEEPTGVDDGELKDVSSPQGGVLIFPNRGNENEEFNKNKNLVTTICDSGYLVGPKLRVPDQNLSFSTSILTLFEALPDHRLAGANLAGQGLKRAAYRSGNRASALSDKDVLSVLTYNVASIPDKMPNSVKCALAWPLGDWGSDGPNIGEACNSRIGNRKRRLREIAESVRAVEPDVIVLLEVFQNHYSGNGVGRWYASSARDALIDEIDDVYYFFSVRPNTSFGNEVHDPLKCATTKSHLGTDKAVYPDQSGSDMTHVKLCSQPRRNALDSGVLIGIRKRSFDPASLGDDFQVFGRADGEDAGAAKGVRYVKASKFGRVYHIFGTHLQSSKQKCASRIGQIRELVQFVENKTTVEIDEDQRIIITGDLNLDAILNNHNRKNDELGKNCRNELEYLVQKLRTITKTVDNRVTAGRVHLSPFSMPFSNDCLLNRRVVESTGDTRCGKPEVPLNKSKQLDHLLWAGAKPNRSGSLILRQTADGENHNLEEFEELSGHYPLLTTLDYRTDTSDERLWTFYEYGDTSYRSSRASFRASRDYDRPVTCPYGFPVEYEPDSAQTPLEYTEPDLVCLPFKCYGNVSSSDGDVCNPATQIETEGKRRYCRSIVGKDKNIAAPCIIPAGYQNLAAGEDVTVSASSYWGQSKESSGHRPEMVINRKVMTASDDELAHTGRAWHAVSSTEDNHWVKITLPTPQYVKRIRFRNGGGAHKYAKVSGVKTYSLYYNDVFGEEGTCSNTATINATRGDADLACAKVFGGAEQKSAQTRTVDESVYTDPDIWHVHEVVHPVLTDEIVFLCDEYLVRGCNVAEIEVYGGAE